MNFADFKSAVQREFAFYGFSACPLNDNALAVIQKEFGDSVDTAYRIGCDVHAGFSFNQSLEANR
jgi:hypothetical protein